jgi:WD40 repeat protein/serine/threonine protein kinase
MKVQMTNPSGDPLEIKRRIDSACDLFETRWGSDPPVTIEDLLRQHADLPREEFLGELVSLEIYLRSQKGEPPSRSKYLQRFPEVEASLRAMLPGQSVLESCEDGDESASIATPVPSPSEVPKRQAAGADGGMPGVKCPLQPLPEIPGFTVLGQICQGGMGVVYRAVQDDLKRPVAIKILKLDGHLDRRQILRFQNEAQAAAQLQHSNIVPVYQVGQAYGLHYYVMQLIEGRDLADHIRDAKEQLSRRKTTGFIAAPDLVADMTAVRPDESPSSKSGSGSKFWPSREFLDSLATGHPTISGRKIFDATVQIGIQAAEALHHAHLHGVVHRDIKPSNLLLGHDGRVWVTDFGLAQVQGASALTMTGEVLGTYRYMSPEQPLANHVLLDQRTDIYSLGITLYELLTLKKAFDGSNSKEILRQVCFEDPVPLRRLNSAIPDDLETIVHKAISKRPEDRYQTAIDFADDLRRFSLDQPIVARRPNLLQRFRRWSVSHPAIASTIVVAFVLIAIASMFVSTMLYRQAQREGQLRSRAELALVQAEAGRLTALSQLTLDSDPTLTILLALEAAKKQTDQASTFHALVEGIRNNHEIRSWNPRAKNVQETGMALHPAGKRVVTTVARGLVRDGDFPAVESDITSGKVLRTYGAKGVVNSAAWSPDGKFLLTTTISQAAPPQELDALPVEVNLWNADNGRAVLTIAEAGFRNVSGAEFSSDSRRLVIPSRTGTLRTFSLPDGTELGPITDPGSAVNSLSFSADGDRLACLLADGRLRVWDFSMRAWTVEITVPAHILENKNNKIGRCAFVNPTTILVAGGGGTRTFSTDTQQDTTAGNLPTDDFALSKSGKSLVLFGSSNQVVVYDTKSMQPSCRIENEDLLLDFAILSEDGRYVALVTWDQTTLIYRIPDGRHITTLPIGSMDVIAAAFSGPEELVTLTSSGQLGLWSLKSGAERHTIVQKFRRNEDLKSPWTFSSDSAYVAFSDDCRWHTDVFDLTGQKVGPAFSGAASAMTPDVHALAVVDDGKVQVRSEANGGILQTLDLPGLPAAEAWSVPASDEVLLSSNQGKSYLWNFSINSLQKLSDSGAAVTDQAVHPISGTLAIAQDNGTVLVKKRGLEQTLRLLHSTKVTAIAFSDSGRLLATADADRQVRVWDLENSKLPQCRAMEGTAATIQQLLFSSDEKLVFCRGWKDDPFWICCWNTETDTLQKTATPLKASGFDITESPGELLIATENGLRLWNYETGFESVLSMVPARKVLSIGEYAFTLESGNPADRKFSNAMLVRYRLADPANPERQSLNGAAFSLTVDRKNQRILAGTYSYQSAAVALEGNRKLSCPVTHSQPILLKKFRGGTRTLVTASREGTIAVWDLETNTARRLVLNVPWISYADMDHDGQYLALVHAEGTVQILNLESEQLQALPQEGTTDVQTVRISPDGQYLVTIHRDHRSKLWRISPGRGVTRVSELLKNTDVVRWSVDGQQLLACGSDAADKRRAEILRPATSDRIMVDCTRQIYDAQFRSDGRQVLLTEFGEEHAVYSTTTGHREAEVKVKGSSKAVFGNAPDQLWLLSMERTVLWDLQRNDAIQQISHRNVRPEIMFSLCFADAGWQPASPDGKWVFCPGNMLEKWPRDLLEFAERTVPRRLTEQEQLQNQIRLPPEPLLD